MNLDKLNRAWYSNSKVKKIFIPNLASWRSRYDLKEQLLLNDYSLVIRNLRASDMVPARSSSDILHIVEAGEEYRPDIIALNSYNDPRLAWVILSANGISDIFDLTVGLEIRIPSSVTLYSSGGILCR